MKATTSEITVESWLAELLRVQESSAEGAFTSRELSKILGHSTNWIHEKLRTLQEDGKIHLDVVRVRKPAIDGTMRVTAAYRIRPVAPRQPAKNRRKP